MGPVAGGLRDQADGALHAGSKVPGPSRLSQSFLCVAARDDDPLAAAVEPVRVSDVSADEIFRGHPIRECLWLIVTLEEWMFSGFYADLRWMRPLLRINALDQ